MSSQGTTTVPLHNAAASAGVVPDLCSINNVEQGSLSSEMEAPPGYPKLAERMGLMPEIGIFRSFGSLNALCILYMQAELMDIEQKLRRSQVRDNKATEGDKCQYARNWHFLEESLTRNGDNEQLQLIRRAQGTLEKYNVALLRQSQIAQMKPPGAYDLKYIQDFLASSDMGPYALRGVDCDIWGSNQNSDTFSTDLVTTLPRHNEDIFSQWVTEKGVDRWVRIGGARLFKPSSLYGMAGYEDSSILRLTSVLSSVVASALPMATIAVLYAVHSIKMRLVIIAIFNLLLSFCLATFTTARRTDIFAVSAAFAAVQVVFVQIGASD